MSTKSSLLRSGMFAGKQPFWIYLFTAVAFGLAISITDASFWADSSDYVDSIIARRNGTDYLFIEFGHLFWRPLGWAIWTLTTQASDAAHSRVEIYTILQSLTIAAGLGSTLLFAATLVRLRLSALPVAIATTGFITSNAFLNFSQSGTSYVAGLMFYTLGLYFSIRAGSPSGTVVHAGIAGASLVVSLCFWMTFLWTIPAVIAAPLLLFEVDREAVKRSGWALVALFVFTGALFGTAALIREITTFDALISWVTQAAHGNETRGLTRMIFGFARSAVNMGNDGVLFKRYLLSDPLNPVSLSDLFVGSLWKLVSFYALVASGFLALIKTDRWRYAVLFCVAAVPMLAFATFFDGGAVERYLPLFPILFLFIAAALDCSMRSTTFFFITGILIVFAGVNLAALSEPRIGRLQAREASRVSEVASTLGPNDVIFVVSWTDSLVNFSRSFPFDPLNRSGNLNVAAVVTPGTSQTMHWRENFAKRSLSTWEKGGEVWLSVRALSESSRLEWNWTEGDDKNVRWSEFPNFFNQLEYSATVGGDDGFALLPPTDHNKRLLSHYVHSGASTGN